MSQDGGSDVIEARSAAHAGDAWFYGQLGLFLGQEQTAGFSSLSTLAASIPWQTSALKASWKT